VCFLNAGKEKPRHVNAGGAQKGGKERRGKGIAFAQSREKRSRDIDGLVRPGGRAGLVFPAKAAIKKARHIVASFSPCALRNDLKGKKGGDMC